MAIQTQPNADITSTWVLIANGVANVTVQVVGAWPAIVFVGSSIPAEGSTDGSRVEKEIAISGLTTESVYARSTSDRRTTISVVKG